MHSITGIILSGEFDRSTAKSFDLVGKDLVLGLTLFQIDHYYSTCWQHLLKTKGELEICDIDSIVFPREIALAEIMRQISFEKQVLFAIIQTDYFGGFGSQYANVFANSKNANKNIKTINEALKYLGVVVQNGLDEFETVGLHKIRSQPEYLERYIELAEQYGL
jgi:hypothetical protein